MTDAEPVEPLDRSAELLRTGAGAVVLERDVVVASGPDASAYLQGQLSQDVAGLPTGSSACSFVLQPQGKVDVWFRLTRVAEELFVLDVDPGWGHALLARLERFRLRTKVELSAATWPLVALRGAGLPPPVDLVAAGGIGRPTAGAAVPGPEVPGVMVLPVRWGPSVGLDLLGPDAAVPAGVPMCDPRALEALRIDAGIPAMGAELTADTIPGEAGAEVIARSVSFTKGCYTGQELVARIDSRGGRTPRRLAHVVVDGPVPPVGAPVALDGAGVGVVTSAAPAGPPPASAPGPTATSGRAVALVSVVRGLETPVAVVVDPAGAASAGLVTELDAPAARAAATDGTVTEPGGGTG